LLAHQYLCNRISSHAALDGVSLREARMNDHRLPQRPRFAALPCRIVKLHVFLENISLLTAK
jgi:hypothetical protein